MNVPGLLSVAEAQARLLAAAEPLGREDVPVEAALGRYLAQPLTARRTQPAGDLSAMDGYALRADDLSGPWTVIGESAAGHPFSGSLAPGEAIRISTGALMPPDAGVILLQENAAREGNRLTLNGEGDPTARHIRRAGFDFRANDEVLPPGTLIGPAQLALALASGHSRLTVHRLAAIAVLDSGDELITDPTDCAPHQIPASNGAMLAAMAAPLVRSIDRLGPVPDRREALASALAKAETAEVIVTSGGASVGDHDLIQPALTAWGAQLDFWRVAMKPGKPLLVARKGQALVLGLPGNPVSSYVTAHIFLLPLLRRLAGARNCLPEPLCVQLAGTLPAGGSRLEFRRAVFREGEVMPISEQDSSALRALAGANALIERPPYAKAATDGAMVRVFHL